MRILILGPQGAGKGTQATVLSGKLQVPHISTGDLFRTHMGDRTALGREAQRYVDAGDLVPDEVTNEMVRERLGEPDAAVGFILDGFPRTDGQADVLERILSEHGVELDAVLELQVPQDVVIERMLARGRDDDTEEGIRTRLRLYTEQTAPLLERYAAIVVAVDGVGEVDEVTARAIGALDRRRG